jgi:D-glycero-alpha-D-manno-heptose-7-phosphate kinase
MILTRTPLRISLFGGGTDLPAFYRNHQGHVLSGAIDKYIYVALKKRFDGKTRVCYSQTELVDDPKELKHDIVRETLVKCRLSGVDIVTFSDVPPHGCGLGSSSAVAVGLVHAIYALRDNHDYSKEELADEACKIEIDRCKKPIGKQDHYATAVGGVREWTFGPDLLAVGCFHHFTKDRPAITTLHERMMLFYTGIERDGDAILSEETANAPTHLRELLGLASMARLAGGKLWRGLAEDLGPLLHQAWTIKKTLAKGISSPQIDRWYNAAMNAGARGGKVLGAGGGGFMLFMANPMHHDAICKALPDLQYIPFRWDHDGSMVVYNGEGPR